MHKPSHAAALVLVLLLASCLPATADKPLVLFDEGHAQIAGNADWVIGGGFSEFADVFKSQGCEVRGVKRLATPEIQGASVLVLPEPNSVYTPEEEAAIVRFVEQGGGLYAIADHDNSDRNGDGIDSRGVLNRFLPRLGLEIDKRYFSEAPTAGRINQTPFTAGVRAVGSWGGTTVKCLSQEGLAHITVSDRNGGGAYIASTIVGSKGGRVVAMGDSSPYDDGTGDPHDKLHNGFSNPKFNHDVLARNSVAWLLGKNQSQPGERLHALLADAGAASRGLAAGADNELAMFLEACEASVVELLRQNPELLGEARSRAAADEALAPLRPTLTTLETFDRLHQE